ncbi:MAG: T9SS type A sorting domain-containing protein [bacterium]
MKLFKPLFVASIVCVSTLMLGIGWMRAGGFSALTSGGIPFRWDATMPVPYNPDLGMLGILTNSEAISLVNENFKLWGTGNIPTSSLSFVNAGSLTKDIVTAADFAEVDGKADNLSPVVFDVDGSLFEALGTDALAFAGIQIVSGSRVVEGIAVFNGVWINGDQSDGMETTVESYAGTIAHEFGHFLNLGHSQVNGHFFLGDDDDPGFVVYWRPPAESMSLMFPISLGIQGEPTVPTTDDIRTISILYPANGFPAGSSTISGRVYRNNGVSEFLGANVIVRNQADPFFDASSSVSGAPLNPTSSGSLGAFQINGLTAGASYSVEVVNVNSRFTAGSRVPPLSVPAILAGPEEFWNGPNESGDAAVDTPLDLVPVQANGTVSNIDFVLNDQSTLIALDKYDSNTEFVLSVQSLITSFATPSGSNDYAAVRYPIPASVNTPFTVARMSFFSNDDQTIWPRVILTTPNSLDQPDLQNPLKEVNNVAGAALGLVNIELGVTRTSVEDLFIVIQFPPGEAISDVGSGGGPAIGADAGRIGNGGFEFGFVPGNLYSADGVTFFETNTTTGAGSVDAANWEVNLEITSANLRLDNLEPNDAMASATAIGYGETRKASIDPAGNLDYFRFSGSLGDTIQADITAQTCGSNLDGFLTLLNSTGQVIATHDDEFAGFGTDPKLQAVLPASGDYFLVMDSRENAMKTTPVGGRDLFYELTVDTFSPALEPDNQPSEATPLNEGETIFAALDLKGDVDFYSFEARAGDFLSAQIFSAGVGLLDPAVGSSLTPVVTLFGTDGTTVLGTDEASTLQLTLPADGTYFLAVTDLNDGGGPDFFYGVSVLLGLNLRTPTGLTATGFKDRVELTWHRPAIEETEPNNTVNQLQELTGPPPIFVRGNAEVADNGPLSINFADGTSDDVEDLYVVRIESPGLRLNLTGTTSDLDPWVFDNPVTSIIGGPTTRGGPADETIDLPNLAAGSYVIGISIFDSAPGGPAESPYNLTVNGDISGTGGVLQSFNIYRSEASNPVVSGTLVGNVGLNTTSFVDGNLAGNVFFYQVTAVYDIGESPPSNEASALVTSVEDNPSAVPATYALHQNYPNPFNPTTVIRYAIPQFHNNDRVKLEIFNMLGQKVRTLVDEQQSANFYTVEWDGTNDLGRRVTSGLYLYRLQAGSFIQVNKMLFLK